MPLDIINTVLCTAAVILLIVVLVRLFTLKTDKSEVTAEKLESLRRDTAAAFNAARSDTAAQTDALRNSLNATNESIGRRIDETAARSSDAEMRTYKELAAMREKLDASMRDQTKTISDAVLAMQGSNEKKLDEMRRTVDEKLSATLTERLDSSFKTVSEQLGNVYKSLGEMKELSGGINALNRVFSGVKTRGNWAETQLESILDQIIPGMYVKNYHTEGSRDVVEFAVIIPADDGTGATYLPVDSKFPTEDYLRLCTAADEGDAEGVKLARKALEARVIAEAKDVKKYISPPETTPFAILYLATDSLYAEILSSKANIADKLHNEFSVMLAGPSTITALLSSLSMGFRTVALNKKAGEIMDLLAVTKAQYDKFADALAKARKKLDEAGKSIDDAQFRNTQIVKKLKGVEAVVPEQADRLFEAHDNTSADDSLQTV